MLLFIILFIINRKKFIYIHIHIHSYSITIHKLFRVVRYIVYLTIFIYTCFGYLRASLRRPTVLQYNTIAAIIVYRIAKRLWFIVCSFFLLKRECGRARVVTALLSYSSKCLIGRDVVMSFLVSAERDVFVWKQPLCLNVHETWCLLFHIAAKVCFTCILCV